MKVIVTENGRVFVESCTECGSAMTVLNECLPKADVLVFRCDNEACGKILSFANPMYPDVIVANPIDPDSDKKS